MHRGGIRESLPLVGLLELIFAYRTKGTIVEPKTIDSSFYIAVFWRFVETKGVNFIDLLFEVLYYEVKIQSYMIGGIKLKLLKITVGNFKNIAKTTIQLSKITALVSTNNYGKTNLLEAIQFGFDFIAASSKGRNNMMHWSKGIPLAPSLAGEEFVFSIEFDAPELGEYRFVRYGFAFSWFNDQETGAKITDEVIEMRANESVRYTSYLKRDKGLYKGGKAKTNFRKVNLTRRGRVGRNNIF